MESTAGAQRHLVYDQTRPPDYSEVISSTRYPVLQASGYVIDNETQPNLADGEGPSKWKLKFADFTPHLAGNNQGRTLTSFEVWLTPSRVFSDDEVGDSRCTTIGVRQYTADVQDVKSLETFDIKLLIRQANNDLLEHPIPGHIITIDTALRPTRADASKDTLSLRLYDTYWTDGAKINRKYVPIIRVFYSYGSSNPNLEIGVTDVLPRIIREAGKQKYEDLESLMIQASDEETCIRCLRIAYTKPKAVLTLRVLRTQGCSTRKRTFAPRRVRTSIDSEPSSDLGGDDPKYRSLTRTVDEISRWLTQTDVHVVNIETLHQQIHDGRSNISADWCLIRQSEEKTREFITLIRIFLRTAPTASLDISPATSIYSRPVCRPPWSRTNQKPKTIHVTRRRCTHGLIIFVISAAILIAGTVIVLVIAVGRGWF
ncbi:hypothetical protein LSH36_797g00028 [Paralvinella palmiformis]|uniref:Uncharacterized protein n=1 Tax=Paralvinella palmiformis TaxID=53620 RepID=A0AAD9IZU8_9ANNE|nr:hypothetical protein LSH36_797g00028 [Paralvinella palmiformis]